MLNKIRRVTDWIVTFLFMALVLIVFIQVLGREAKISIPWADELARYCFVWLVYLGGTVTVRKGMNISFDIILESATGWLWTVMFTLVNLISLVFLVMAVVLGVEVCLANTIQNSSIMKLNMGAVMAAVPIGAFLMIFEQISYYITQMKKRNAKEGDAL